MNNMIIFKDISLSQLLDGPKKLNGILPWFQNFLLYISLGLWWWFKQNTKQISVWNRTSHKAASTCLKFVNYLILNCILYILLLYLVFFLFKSLILWSFINVAVVSLFCTYLIWKVIKNINHKSMTYSEFFVY